jgi:D-glutamate N-acetyltransferase
MLGKQRRLAVLAEGSFTPLDGKTAVGVLRYRSAEVAAVIDSTRTGRSCEACVGVGGAIPVVADVASAATLGADALLIGIAPQGGELPASWRAIVRDALGRGWDVLSGLHVFLGEDPELAALARERGGTLLDVRRTPARRPIATARAAQVDALVVLTVGSDCNVGKMTAALELRRELTARGVRAAFVATGQTGIMVADHGVSVDAVPADFVAGFAEEMVLEAARDAEVVLVEGQGALRHPGYSGVTLALMHGAAPAAMVLCHACGRESIRRTGGRGGLGPDAAITPRPEGTGRTTEGEVVIPALRQLVREYEETAAWVSPSRVVAVALNTRDLDERGARATLAEAVRETGLPASDPVRFGAGPLAEAVLAALAARRGHATAT